MKNKFVFKTELEIWTDEEPSNLSDFDLLTIGYTIRTDFGGTEINLAPRSVQINFKEG